MPDATGFDDTVMDPFFWIMAKFVKKIPVRGGKALEMAMRDVMDSMADSASYFAYRSTPDTLEILSIEPPGRDPFRREPAEITTIQRARSHDIVDYLYRREAQLERIQSAV